MDTDKFTYFPGTADALPSRANQPVKYTQADMGKNGYPNSVPNTQKQKARGTGAATKGTGHSKKMG
jgi:hypothetical protein